MALRLFAEYKSSKDILHRIEVHDDEYTGSAVEFYCNEHGAIMQYEGVGENMYKPTLPSRMRVGMMVKTEDHESFIAEIANAKEGRFVTRLAIAGEICWVGTIVNDLAEIEDAPYPYLYEIEAVCGLGLLKKINYANGYEPVPGLIFWNEEPYTDKISLLEHVIRALSKLNSHSTDFHPATFMHTAVNFFAQEMTFGIANCPLKLASIRSYAFWNVVTGAPKYSTCLEVIEDVMRVFGCRIYYWQGWRIEQVIQRQLSVITRWRVFDINGGYLSNYANAYSVTVNQSSYARMAGGKYTFYPPQRLVEITYENRAARDLIDEYLLYDVLELPAPTVPNDNSSLLTLRYVNKDVYTIEAELGGPTPGYRYWARLKCKLKVGTKWYRRSIAYQFANGQSSIIYGAPEWSDDEGYFYTYYKMPAAWNTGQVKYYANIQIDTVIDLESTGEFAYEESMDVVYWQNLPSSGWVEFEFDNTDYTSQKTGGQGAQAWLLFDGNPMQSSRYKIYETKSFYRGSEDIKFKTLIGDQIGDTYAPLMVSNTETTGWRIGNTGTYKPLLQLAVETIMSGNAKTTKRYKGRIYGNQVGPIHRLAWDSNGFVFMGGTFYTNLDEVEGEWYALKTDSATNYSNGIIKTYGIDPNTPVGPSTPPTPTGTFDHELAAPGGSSQTQPPPALEIFAATTLGAVLSSGTASEITVTPALVAGAFPVGSTINIVNPDNGQYVSLTVAAPIADGDDTVTVTGTVPVSFPVGSYVMYSQQNATTTGGAGSSGGTTPSSITVASAGTISLASGKLLSHLVFKATGSDAVVSIGTSLGGTQLLDSLDVTSTAIVVNLSHYADSALTIHITTSQEITVKSWIL